MKKITSFLLVLAMLVGVFSCVGVFAAENDTPSVEIVSKNVWQGETLNLMFAVQSANADDCELDLTITAPNGDDVRVIDMGVINIGAKGDAHVYRAAKGEAAQNINKVYTATATLYDANGEIVAEDSVTYSVLEYAHEYIAKADADPDQKAMCEALLVYAAAADKAINKENANNIAEYVYVNVSGAATAATGMYKVGSTLNITPNVEITEDMTAYWIVNGEEKTLEEMTNYTITAQTVITLYTSLHVCSDADGDFICDDDDNAGCTKVVAPAADSVLTIAQARKLAALFEHNTYTDAMYYVEGTVKEVKNTTFGNMYITDGAEELYVYGVYQGGKESGTRYDAMTEKPVAGDTVKLYGAIGAYGSELQMKEAELIEFTAHVCEDNVVVDEAVDATCTATGLTEGSHCGLCAKVLVEQTVTDKLAHNYVDGVCSCGAEENSSAPSEPQYTQVTKAEDFTTGTYIIVATNGKELGNYNSTWVKPVTETPTVENGVVVEGGTPWTLTVTDGKVTIMDENGVFIKPKGGNNNGINTGEYACAFAFDADGNVTFSGTGTDTVMLAWNAQNSGFRFYKNSTASGYVHTFTVYKLG